MLLADHFGFIWRISFYLGSDGGYLDYGTRSCKRDPNPWNGWLNWYYNCLPLDRASVSVPDNMKIIRINGLVCKLTQRHWVHGWISDHRPIIGRETDATFLPVSPGLCNATRTSVGHGQEKPGFNAAAFIIIAQFVRALFQKVQDFQLILPANSVIPSGFACVPLLYVYMGLNLITANHWSQRGHPYTWYVNSWEQEGNTYILVNTFTN